MTLVRQGRPAQELLQAFDDVIVNGEDHADTRYNRAKIWLLLKQPDRALADLSLAVAAPVARGEVLLMATDGVSEDLERDRLGDLARWVVDTLGPLRRPGAALARELRAWPVPPHRDDKPLLTLWKP